LLRREIAEAIPSVMAGSGVNVAALTVTQVTVASNLRNATVGISVFAPAKERAHILSQVKARRGDFQRLVNRDIRMKYTPVLRFVLDESLEKGDRVLDILAKMEEQGELAPSSEAEGAAGDAE
ncbi:MAG: 30S ribosome-binding factor RbfA, partial [Kiritimatiellae bacterium]|nr:30S ribosome-binding factor RbfA [Kiritimatiellia bacterium]